jgi:tetratricopeptide (TPR) repeat protein
MGLVSKNFAIELYWQSVLKIVLPRKYSMANSPIQSRRGFSRPCLVAVLLLASACYLLSEDAKSGTLPAPEKAGPHGYDYRFGASPFLPSQAKSTSSKFVDAAAFPTAAFCSKCHEDVHQQWRQSAHANSFRAPFYKKNVDLLIAQKGIEFSRHCEGCHNPIALLSGALTKGSTADRSFDEDGITCMVCHSIQKVQNTSGTGSYIMGQPAVMVSEDGSPVTTPVTFDDILARPKLHGKAVMRDFYRTPEFCSVCHKAFLPRMLNDYKWMRAFSVYDEWQQSSWARQSPLPFYQKDVDSTCQTCHMPHIPSQSDYSKDHQVASHRWPGANTAIPFFYGYDEQMKVTDAYLKDTLGLDIFAMSKVESGKERLIAPLDRQNFNLLAGETVTVGVVIQNKKIGHNLVPEQRDFYECWVEFIATDANGAEIFHSGFIKPDGNLDDQAHTYTNRLITKEGKWIDLHQVWDMKIKVFDSTIPSGQSDLVRFKLRIPPGVAGPITLKAQVNYRRFRRAFTNFILGKNQDYPIVTMVSKSLPLHLGRTEGSWPAPDRDQMLRWNNYGIALLRQQQYWKAADAFRKVVEIDPTYADGYVNLAISTYSRLVDTRIDPDGAGNMSAANSSYDKYEPALHYLNQALEKKPSSMRAIFYKGLIYRLENQFDDAIANLLPVVKAYPRFRQARQELGYAYFLEKKYQLSREQFEALQSINPDDLSAHFYLSQIYSQLGMGKEAAEEGAIYAEHRDDPGAGLLALDFRYRNPLVAHENEPYHLHEGRPVPNK